jgi:RNA polymerase sigma factor (sigma-70 family)
VQATRLATVTDGSTELERCYRRQYEKLWRSLLLFSANPEVASDAISEAFAQALRRGDGIRDLDRWIWKSAFAIARGELRHGSMNETLIELPQEIPVSMVDLVRALDRLSPKQRASVVLHHYSGYSTKETAAIIGSTAPAVGVHLQRGRARLRALLREDDDE